MHPFLRRLALPIAAVTAAAGLLVLGGTATADTAHPDSNVADHSDARYTKTVVDSQDVVRGGIAKYRIELTRSGTSEAWVSQMRDYPPTGFTAIPGTATVTYAGGASDITYESDGSVTAKCKNGCSLIGSGWVVKSGQSVVFEVSYQVPAEAALGWAEDGGFTLTTKNWIGASSNGGTKPFNVWVNVANPTYGTETTLDVPPNAKVGVPADLIATVAPATATGTVQFKDGNDTIGDSVPVSGGSATLSHSFTSVGKHSITATYIPESGFHGSSSSATPVTVTADTATAISAPTTALVGDSITVKATVTPANAVGTVQFKDGINNLGDPVDVVDGEASMTRLFDSAGSHSYTAVFTGSDGYLDSTSTATDVTVDYGDWNTTTTLEAITAVAGEPINLSATISPIPGSGDVTFEVDGIPVGTVPVGTGDGVAVLSHTFNTVGTAEVVAKFTGGSGFTSSESEAATATIKAPEPARLGSTTVLSVAGSATAGQTLTLTATVQPVNATGFVQFKIGTTPVGGPIAVVNGVATTTHVLDSEGTYAVTAAFTPDAAWSNSVSGPTVIQVAPAVTDEPGGIDTGSLGNLFGS